MCLNVRHPRPHRLVSYVGRGVFFLPQTHARNRRSHATDARTQPTLARNRRSHATDARMQPMNGRHVHSETCVNAPTACIVERNRTDALTGETLEDFAQKVVDGLCNLDHPSAVYMNIVEFFQTRRVTNFKSLQMLSVEYLKQNFRTDIALLMWACLHPQVLIVDRLCLDLRRISSRTPLDVVKTWFPFVPCAFCAVIKHALSDATK
jgi:hypothetical protein